MKTFNLFSSILFLFVLVASCSKDSEVVTSFPFTLSESHPDSTVINTPQETFFKITPEKEVTTNKYFFRYEVVSGSGKYFDEEGTVIPPKQDVELSSLSPTFFFKASKTGSEKVKVYVKDNSGTEETIDVVYNVQHNPFTVSLSAPYTEAPAKDKIPITLSVFNEGDNDNITYERAFFIVQGSGSIKAQGSDDPIALETFAPMKPGTFSFDLAFNDVGETKIKVAVRDSNNQLIEQTLSFSILDVSVSFSATINKNSLTLGSENLIFFSLSEDQGEGGSYQLKYIVNNGDVDISNDDGTINPGVFVNVVPGSFSWSVFPASPGPVDISFILKNQNGVEITRSITFDILDVEVTFSAAIDNNVLTLGSENKIFFSLTEDQGQGGPYQMKFIVNNGDLEMYNNGQVVNPGVFVNVVPGSFSWSAYPLTGGTIDISFVLINENNVQFNDEVSFEASPNELSLSVGLANENPIYVEETKDIGISIDSQQGAGGNYKLKYVVNQGEVHMLSNNNLLTANTFHNVNLGSFSWVVKGIASGPVDITFSFMDEFGTIVSQDLSFTVFEHTLNLNLVPSDNESYSHEAIDISATITQTPVASPPYAYSFSSSGEGVIMYNNNTYQEGDVFYVLGTNIDFKYIPYSPGSHNILISAENAEGAADDFPINLSVLPHEFTVESSFKEVYGPDDLAGFGHKYSGFVFYLDFATPNQNISIKFSCEDPDVNLDLHHVDFIPGNTEYMEQGVYHETNVFDDGNGYLSFYLPGLDQAFDTEVVVTFKNQFGVEKQVIIPFVYQP